MFNVGRKTQPFSFCNSLSFKIVNTIYSYVVIEDFSCSAFLLPIWYSEIDYACINLTIIQTSFYLIFFKRQPSANFNTTKPFVQFAPSWDCTSNSYFFWQ
ncbi:hypothetical protein FKM82_012896 [Ascaphus truei]